MYALYMYIHTYILTGVTSSSKKVADRALHFTNFCCTF